MPGRHALGWGRLPREARASPALAGRSQQQPCAPRGRSQQPGQRGQDPPSPGLVQQFSAPSQPDHRVHRERVCQLAGLFFSGSKMLIVLVNTVTKPDCCSLSGFWRVPPGQRQAPSQLPLPWAQLVMEITPSGGLEKLQLPKAKSLGEMLGKGCKGTGRNHCTQVTSLIGSAAKDDLCHQTPLPRAAHLLIFIGKDPISDVLIYQGCAASYLTSIFSSSKATSSEMSMWPGQRVTYCCL